MKQNSPTISLTNQNKPGLFSNLVLWNNPLAFLPDVWWLTTDDYNWWLTTDDIARSSI